MFPLTSKVFLTVCSLVFLQFYGYLSQQQNMMQDYVRTGTYQRAILQNHTDFKDKVTLWPNTSVSYIQLAMGEE